MILPRAYVPLLERVFVNLLENVQKYAGQGEEIGVRAEKRTDTLRITVWDNGPGLPVGKENQLFDKFTRGHQESAIPRRGMGLVICRAIVEMHQGEIYAANRPSGGACFTIILPLPPTPALEEPLQEDA